MFKRLLGVIAAALVGKMLGLGPEVGLASLALFAGPTIISGQRGTSDLSTNRLKIDMDDVSLLNPNKSPFIALITRLNRKSTHNPQYYHIERQLLPRWDAINLAAGYAAGDTSLVVDNGDYFSVDDLVKVPRTGEVMHVTVVATNTLTVTRSVGETAAAALVDNDPLQIIGNMNEEGASKRTLKTTQSVEVYNYTQIFRNPYGVTGTENASEMWGEKDLAQIRYEIGVTHAIDIERAFLFGERINTTGSNSKPKRGTRGLLYFIDNGTSAARKVDVAGNLTESVFREWLRELFTNDPDQARIVFVSRLVADVIDGWAGDKLQMVPKDQTYGIHINKYRSAVGEVFLVQHHLLTGAIYGGYAVGVALKECGYRFLNGRDTHLKTGIQNNDVDGMEEEYLSEVGFMLKHPEKQGYLKGITG
jgi:hypothetical protein